MLKINVFDYMNTIPHKKMFLIEATDQGKMFASHTTKSTCDIIHQIYSSGFTQKVKMYICTQIFISTFIHNCPKIGSN